MPFTRHRYHIVTATKGRQPLITPDIETVLYDQIKHNALLLNGRILYINGIEDHIHIIAAIPPAIAVSKFVARIKAASCLYINQRSQRQLNFAWQTGYGSFTVDPDNMQALISYVLNQKEHHAQGTTNPRFERTEE